MLNPEDFISRANDIVYKLINGESLNYVDYRRTGKTTLATTVTKALLAHGKTVYFVPPTHYVPPHIQNELGAYQTAE